MSAAISGRIVAPVAAVENAELFVLKVVGGAVFLIGAGLVVYIRRPR